MLGWRKRCWGPLAMAGILLSLIGCAGGGLPQGTTAGGALDELVASIGGLGDLGSKVEDAFSVLRTNVTTGPLAAGPTRAVSNLGADALAAEGLDVPVASILAEVTGAATGVPIEHGRLGGQFVCDDPNSDSYSSAGSFAGRWVGADGQEICTIEGRFEPLPPDEVPPLLAGAGVFEGRLLDPNGVEQGILRGRYGHRAEGPGRFFGRWFDVDEHLRGVLKGFWHDLAGTGGGKFAGRWAAFNICEEVATLPAFEFEPGDVGGLDELEIEAGLPVVVAGAGLEAAVDADGLGVRGALPDEPPCIDPNTPHGYVGGRYRPHDPNDPNALGDGILRGRWRGPAGHMLGFVRGYYEAIDQETEDGPHVMGRFYAKYTAADGTLLGYVRAAYGRGLHGVGVFRGEYLDLNKEKRGEVQGRWRHVLGRPGGAWRGVWYGAEL